MKVLRKIKDIARDLSQDRPALRKALIDLDMRKEMARHALGAVAPQVIRPKLKQMTVAITAHCNLRCIGCRYGRDFMPGHQLSLPMVKDLLTDGRAGGGEILEEAGPIVALAYGISLATYYLRSNPPRPEPTPATGAAVVEMAESQAGQADPEPARA